MKELLRHDFTTHYGLNGAGINIFSHQTDATYFELKDDETLIYLNRGDGCAVYQNNNELIVSVTHYELFINNFPERFQRGRKRCDLIVYTLYKKEYFLLNELKDTNPTYRNTAIDQLSNSLKDLMAVQTIRDFANTFIDRRCCFFNKRVIAPDPISATISFNLVNTISSIGFQMTNPDIEAYGFALFEYSGGQVFVL